MKKRKLAIFDIDGTIFRSSLVIELTEALIHAGIFPGDAKNIYEKTYRDWLDRKGSYESYIDAVVKAFGSHIKGNEVSGVNAISGAVVKLHKDRVYRYTRDLVNKLKNKKYYIVAISYSPRHTVKNFCENLGFDEIFGTVYESEEGKFNGIQWRPGSDKAKILQLVLRKEDLTLKDSVGVGDTESDIPFLKMVENPICFNPNMKLYAYAKRKGWKTVVERKDVVYEI